MHRYRLCKLIVTISVILLPDLASSQETYRFERMWPTFNQPWYFKDPEGLAIDGKGNVYVADKVKHQIQKFNANGCFISKWGSYGSGDGNLNGPSGLAIDSSNNVYVIDTKNHRIQKFDANGGYITKWGSSGAGDGQFDFYDGSYNSSGIEVDGSDNIYVADYGNHRIQKFDANGGYITKWGSYGSGDGNLNGPSGLAIDSNNNVYVIDTKNHRIQKFDANGGYITKWGSSGAGDGQFDFYDGSYNSSGIEVDGSDNIYVADYGNHRIQKFDANGGYITKWGSYGLGDGQFDLPRGIVVDGSGNVYVSDYQLPDEIEYNNRIQKFSPDGIFISKWYSLSGNGEFKMPTGIAVDASDNIYVADYGNHRIQKFDANGGYITKWGSYGSGDGNFNVPSGVAIDSNNNVYVVDMKNDRIQKFDSDGGFITKWYLPFSISASLTSSIAVDGNNNVYVANEYLFSNFIQKFDSNGGFITQWQTSGSFGIAIDSNSNVYVTNLLLEQIEKYSSNGTFIISWPADYPLGISVDNSDNIYVSNLWDKIQKFSTDGQYISEWGNHGSDPGFFDEVHGLCVSSTGRVYVADTFNQRIQLFKKVIFSQSPKAIIVAGRASTGDSLWDATQVCANFAYRALTYQGYTDEDIYYLSADTDLDLNGNGVPDVDADATLANLQSAVTQWAETEGADNLVVYLNDHGGPDTFRLSETDILSSSDLATWLDTFQSATSARITLLYEACESGSFIDNLQGNDRIIITSTLPGEQAKFLSHGIISFSNFFWTHIFNGLSIEEAYLNATEIVNFAFSNQNPQLSGDAENFYIGSGVTGMVGEAPEIGSVSESQEITGEETTATLSADDVIDPDGIARVWAVIWPPDFDPGSVEDPLLDIPTCELLPVGGDSYEGTYSEFTTDGTYQIAIYAMDRNNNTSLPQLTTVSRNYNVTRRAMIIAGGSSSSVTRSMIETNAGIAYDALKSQLFTDDDIEFRSVTTFRTEVDGAPSNSNLQSHLNSLATHPEIDNLDLTLYFIGEGNIGTFTMNDDPETLTASQLDTWLDILQTAKPGSVKIIYDGDKSGSFISPLTLPSPPDERIIITSTGVDAPAYFSGEGDTCFSSFFWSQVASGATLYNALGYAKQAISFLSRQGEISFACYNPQSPLIDADGDGTPNEEDDYQIARSRTIGIGLRFADDPPQIGSASVEEELGVVTIVAEDITTTSTLDRVWAVIKPIGYCPGYSGEETQEFEEVELVDLELDGKYEGTYTDPIACYKVSVYAMDVDGNTSLPKETKIYQEGGDIYEDPDNDGIFDDDRSEANVIVPGHPTPQPHTFHFAADEDWVKFYGINGEYYTILADNLEADCAPILELYFEDDPVPITVGYTILNDTVSIDFACLENGVYHVLLYNSTTGVETGYDLQVYYPYWPALVLIAGNVEEEGTPNDIDGAYITTDGGGSAISVAGEYEFTQKPGSWLMDAFASGYGPYSDSLFVGTEPIQKDIEMTSVAPADEDDDTIANDEDNCLCHYNPGQEDTVPPGGDGIGDACAGDKGNVNGGGMDVGDIQMIINIFLITHSPTGYEYWAADCNNDGKISVSDVQIAINKLL